MTHELFISYARTDTPWVEGYLLPALDLPADQVLTPQDFELGIPVVTAFEQAISQSRYTLLILSPAYLADEWAQFSEQLASFARVTNGQQRLIPLYLKPCTLPLHLDFLVRLDCTEEANWANEIIRLRTLLAQPAPVAEQIPCPYPGMVPFTEADAGRFFGREPEIENLRRKLRHQDFLLVIGPSGSGKSSLVFAGLGPELQKQEPSRWQIRAMRPGVDPCATLKATVGDLVDLQTFQSKTQRSEQVTLLIVDQFEEIFVQTPKSEQVAFIAMVKSLHQAKACKLVLTLRADFFPDLMNSNLWPIDPSQREEIAPLHGEALRRAILQPATGVGVFLEPGLVERLLADAADEPGVLPLLQETLVLLWEKRVQRFLPLSTYSQLGTASQSGLAIALANKADATLAVLTPDQQNIARRIFLRLVQFGEGRPDTRRQQTVTALQNAEEGETVFRYVLSHLADNRLLTLTTDESGHEQRIDISHEKLITGWPRLQIWLKAQKEDEQLRRRLEEKAKEWVRLGQHEGGLLDKAELQEAEPWLKKIACTELGASSALLALIDASRKAINPGWHLWGTIGLSSGVIALAAIVAWLIIWIEINRLPGAARLMTLVFLGLLGVALLWAFIPLRRADPHLLQRLTHNVARSGRQLAALTGILVLSLILWLIYGVQIFTLNRACADLGYKKDTGAVTVAVFNNSDDPLGTEVFAQALEVASFDQIKAHVTTQADAKKCRNFFAYQIKLRIDTSLDTREIAYIVEIERLDSSEPQQLVQVVKSKLCSRYGQLAFKVADNLGLLPIEHEQVVELPTPIECAPYLDFLHAYRQVYKYHQYAAARAILERLVQQYPEYAEAHALLGFVYCRTPIGLYNRATAELKQATRLLSVPYVPFLEYLAIACYRSGDYACAEKASLALLTKNPQHIDGHLVLSTIYREEGKYVEAKDVLNQSKALINTLTFENDKVYQQHRIVALYGILAIYEKKWQEAIDLLQEADGLGSELTEEIVYYLAISFEKVGDVSKACLLWERYQRVPSGELFREEERRQDAHKQMQMIKCLS